MKILKMLVLLCMMGAAGPSVSATPIDVECPQFVYGGAPTSIYDPGIYEYRCKTNYAILYRKDTKTPEYVTEHITRESIAGPFSRTNDFRPDTTLLLSTQAQLSDYAGSGYDRGHLSAAADNTESYAEMSDSFLLSNVIPQPPSINRGVWKKLESSIRSYVDENGPVYVISGTKYDHGYKTIGENHVGVPSFVWKVIIDPSRESGVAYLINNEFGVSNDLASYQLPIQNLEQATGLDFMPNINAGQIESGIQLQLNTQ